MARVRPNGRAACRRSPFSSLPLRALELELGGTLSGSSCWQRKKTFRYLLYDMKICMLLVGTREHGEKGSVLQRMIKKKKKMIQLSRGCLNSEPEGQEIKHEEDNGREEEADIKIMKENE
ncbi:hypothetical protein VPH35_037057 [Triticum aestivum]|uniref:Uncharacterized protein n=1 Tax=Aegilops tauschii TaxID=37682 RepID=M8BT28_AEGTA